MGSVLTSSDDSRSRLSSSFDPVPVLLIVEDDLGVIDTFSRMLRFGGYDVLAAMDADHGLRAVETSHPDAVFVDLRMPLADGAAFLRRLRARDVGRHTPVAIMTGDHFASESLGNDLSELHAELHFKPLGLGDLVAIAQRLVAKRT